MMNSNELINKILFDKPKNKEGWFELKGQVHNFLDSNAPDEEKEKLCKYTEMLLMVCNAYTNMK